MGKNQQYKQRQMSKVSSRGPSGGGGDEDAGDGMVMSSLHVESIQPTHRRKTLTSFSAG